MWPEFDSRFRCYMWVEFVVGSRPCSERFFSGNSGFPRSSKTNIFKFQFDPGPERNRFVSPRLLVSPSLNKVGLFIYFIYLTFNILTVSPYPLVHDWYEFYSISISFNFSELED